MAAVVAIAHMTIRTSPISSGYFSSLAGPNSNKALWCIPLILASNLRISLENQSFLEALLFQAGINTFT